jgi:hypothetical protein
LVLRMILVRTMCRCTHRTPHQDNRKLEWIPGQMIFCA